MTIIIDGTVGANKAVVLDSNGKLPAIDGSLLTTLNATQVTTGSIATARLDAATTGANKVLILTLNPTSSFSSFAILFKSII